jgi:uncharacterized protein (UPF0335 family)
MLAGHADREQKAEEISAWLADHKQFRSHARHICRDDLEARGLAIEHLERDQQIQDAVLSVFHATSHGFDKTTMVKLIENHMGRAFIKAVQMVGGPPRQ